MNGPVRDFTFFKSYHNKKHFVTFAKWQQPFITKVLFKIRIVSNTNYCKRQKC